MNVKTFSSMNKKNFRIYKLKIDRNWFGEICLRAQWRELDMKEVMALN